MVQLQNQAHYTMPDGRVSFPELSGCLTCGDTKEKAIANAIDAKRAWFEAALEAGMEINIPGVPSKDI